MAEGVEMKRWFTFEEIAKELEIPLQSFYFYCRRGKGPKVYKFGRHYIVLDQDFVAWKQEQLQK